MDKDSKRVIRNWLIAVAIIIGLAAIYLIHSQSGQRALKSFSSNVGGGLNRTVTVYDYNGEVVKQWEGKFDIQEDNQEIYFDDQDGKRVIIQGGIVISEEK